MDGKVVAFTMAVSFLIFGLYVFINPVKISKKRIKKT